MKSDTAMWASVILSDHLRTGTPIEEVSMLRVGRAIASLLKYCRFQLDDQWNKLAGDADRVYLPYLIECRTGDLIFQVTSVVSPHVDAASDALSSRSWAKMSLLHADVWRYVTAITGMTGDEWHDLPSFCEQLLREPVRCPSCDYLELMKRFGEPDSIHDPFDFDCAQVSLVFHCPRCGTAIIYDIKARDSSQHHTSLMYKSKTYKWAVIAVFAFIAYWLIKLMFHLF